jgi:hypothetical protein
VRASTGHAKGAAPIVLPVSAHARGRLLPFVPPHRPPRLVSGSPSLPLLLFLPLEGGVSKEESKYVPVQTWLLVESGRRRKLREMRTGNGEDEERIDWVREIGH